LDNGIELNCPNLIFFSFDFASDFFKRPKYYKQIKKLNCYHYRTATIGCKFLKNDWIKELENLEEFNCSDFYDNNDKTLLRYFPKLKILNFFRCELSNWLPIEREKIGLNRNNLKTYYYGREYDEEIFMNIKRYTYPQTIPTSLMEVYANDLMKFYGNDFMKLAETILAPCLIQYYPFLKNCDQKFFRRFANIQAVIINQFSITQNEMLKLINCLKNIVILWIANSKSLNQDFYNILPYYYPHLRILCIDNRGIVNFDFKFLFKLNELYKLVIRDTSLFEENSDYQELIKKVQNKREEIENINGKLLFNKDKERLSILLDLDNPKYYFYGYDD
jgi:hypothetical protein